MTKLEPLDAMGALVLEDGRKWGDVAAEFQWADVRAVFGPDGPLWFFFTRPRGGSKSFDLAGILLVWLVCLATPGERAYIIASDRDQGTFAVLDAIAGIVRRTEALKGHVTLQADKVIGPGGATIEVLSADGASSWGLRPSFVVVDELASWASTRNARQVWVALVSALHKVPGCRFVCLTSAGTPGHWSFKVLKGARKEKAWHVHEVAGPLPWVDPTQLEAQRPLLRDSEFSRLHLNLWTEGEERLVREEDLEAAACLDGPLEPVPGRRYVACVDLGLVNDRTVCCVAHGERLGEGYDSPVRVVVDCLKVWTGSRKNPVSLDEVEAYLELVSRNYNRAQLIVDPWQSAGLCQRLRRRSIPVEEFQFSSTSVGRIASALHLALRNRLIWIPDVPDVVEELANVRLKETTPGVVRLDHASGQHDDVAVTLGLACVRLQVPPPRRGLAYSLDDNELAEWQIMNARVGLGLLSPIGTRVAPPAKEGFQFSGDTSLRGAGIPNLEIDDDDDDPDERPNGKTARSPYV